MQTDYESKQTVEIVTGDHSHEVEFIVGLRCISRSYPGCFDPRTGGEPPEGPEFDYATIQVCAELVKGEVTIDLTPNQLVALVGPEIEDHLFDVACIEAAETGDF